MRCPACGSDRVVVIPLEGAIVCMNCGYVIEENMVDISGGTRSSEYTERLRLSVKRWYEKPLNLDKEKTDSIVAVEKRKHRQRLERLIKAKKSAEIQLVAKTVASFKLKKLEEITVIAEFLSKRGLITRYNTRTKLALLEAVYEYLHGRYPRFTLLARKYNVSPESIKKGFKRIIEALGGDSKRLAEIIDAYKGGV